MLRRVRTTKKLAKRIDPQYFTKPHPFRRWRLWLSILVPAVAVAWFAALRAKADAQVPVEVTRAALARADAVQARFNAFVRINQQVRRDLHALWPARPASHRR